MSFSSRLFALIIASVVTFFTLGFMILTKQYSVASIFVVGGVCFGTAFLFIFLAFEFLIFKEINDLRVVLDKIRNNTRITRRKKIRSGSNPIKKLNEEIYNLTLSKQLEIEELKRMEEYRRDFLANVSHELKTPIFSAQGFIQTLLDGAKDDEEVLGKFLKKSSKSLDSLSILVEDLLTISQLESGEITMQKDFFDIRRMTVDIFDQLEGKTKNKNYTLTLLPETEAPIEAYGDPYRIRQVMTNLIDNGIKYGHDGGNLTVKFKVEDNYTHVIIKDNGPGIDAEKLPRLFERFYRVDKHRSRESGGTGLGLSIVKHIIESHDSEISVESEVGKGTKFKFKIANT